MTNEIKHEKISRSVRWTDLAFWRKPFQDEKDEEHDLPRTLSLFDLTMIGIGGTVGAGVFATAGLIASTYSGPAAVFSWLLAGIGCLLSGFSYMELSVLLPAAGSTYVYAYHALGELPAMLAGFLLTLEYGIASAGGARSWSAKFQTWLITELQVGNLPNWLISNGNNGYGTLDLFAGGLMTLVVCIVLRGLTAGKFLINVVTLTKICVVLFIIIMGLQHFNMQNITPWVPDETFSSELGHTVYGIPGIFLGASASFFGYIGYDEVCCLAGEAKNPSKNIPRAVILTIIGAATLSTLATLSLVGMQQYTEIDAAESYGNAFEQVGWPWAAFLVSTGEVLTMPITTFIGFLAQPRVQYAMAKDGLLPQIFTKLDNQGNLYYGTAICGIIAISIALFVPFHVLWDLISLGILVAFNLTNCALLLVRWQSSVECMEPDESNNKKKSWFGPVLISFLVCSYLAAYHIQHAVISVPLSPINVDDITLYLWYMTTLGPIIAGFFTIFAFTSMFVLWLLLTNPRALDSPIEKHENLPHAKKQSPMKDVEMVKLSPLRHRKYEEKAKSPKKVIDDDEESDNGFENVTDVSSSGLPESVNSLVEVDLSSPMSKVTRPQESSHFTNVSQGFQAPLVPFTPCCAIFFNWFLFAQMAPTSVALIFLYLVIPILIYIFYSRHHSLARQNSQYAQLHGEDHDMS